MAGHYRQLIAWRKGIDFVDLIYDATATFPKEERFGIISQLQRAAVSIPSNIAEGQAHTSRKDFIRCLRLARGSLAEVETQLTISARRRYLSSEKERHLLSRADELNRILGGLIASLKKKTEEAEEEKKFE